MKLDLKRLAITAMLLSSTSMTFADDGTSSRVGDLPGFGEDAYFDDADAYAENSSANDPQVTYENEAYAVSQTGVIEPSPVRHASRPAFDYAPIGLSSFQPAGYREHHQLHTYAEHSGCDGGCDSGCKRRHHLKLKKIVDCDTWATAEALLWFPQSRKLPSLVTSSAAGTVPVLSPGGGPASGVNTLFGGEIDGGLSAGFRVDYGKWINKDFGVGGRFWWIGENSESYSATGLNGSNGSVGLPFFDINPISVGENALLIAFNNGATELTGDVSVESRLEMRGAEAYGRFRFGSSKTHQLDFIGGYSHFRIDDSFSLYASNTVVVNPPLAPVPGTVRTFNDSFEAENRFNGGQIGFDLSATRGRWMVRSLTKVHLGNMNQRYNISGRSSNAVPGNATDQYNIGFLAQEGNSGRFERDVFAFVPEANFKLAYRFRPNVLLSVGYSFLYFDNVALNGSVIDRAVDGPLLATGVSGTNPAFVFDDDSLFVHGIDLGAVIDF